MASLRKTDIKVTRTPVKIIDRLASSSGASPPYIPPPGTITLIQHSPSFTAIIGDTPTHSLLISSEKAFFHEACVYTPESSELWITSNGIPSVSSAGKLERAIFISKLKLERAASFPAGADSNSEGKGRGGEVTAVTWSKMRPPPNLAMPNGGVNSPSGGILICAQGSRTSPGGIYHTSPSGTSPLITTYLGRPFNSPNDVVVAKDGGVWFTDPSYGHDQGFKPAPELPEQVYRYDPSTGDVRCVADGFGRPNGICFAPDESTCYITDTGTSTGRGEDDPRRPSTIYAFDIKDVGGQPQAGNRRVFAFVAVGFPDGIKCDVQGNVYAACGDGVWVWNKGGLLLGKIATGGWVANFCFGEGGEVFVCNETRVWRVKLGGGVRGALLRGLGELE